MWEGRKSFKKILQVDYYLIKFLGLVKLYSGHKQTLNVLLFKGSLKSLNLFLHHIVETQAASCNIHCKNVLNT